jgi:hypothetical protein
MERAMMISTKILIAATLAITLPVAALAQSSDANYCNALSDTYKRYVGTGDIKHRGLISDSSVDNAIAHCQSDAANSIPVLEKALKGAKVDLPPHG